MNTIVSFKDGSVITLPRVTMTNGITINLFDPYDITLANAVINQLEPYMKNFAKGGFDTIVVPATKPIPIAWWFAKKYNLELVVIRKEVKPYYPNRIEFECKSITSDRVNKMFITDRDLEYIEHKNVIFFDDVLSTGATYEACKKFINEKCKCDSFVALFVFKEGNSYQEGHEVHYCGNLPFE